MKQSHSWSRLLVLLTLAPGLAAVTSCASNRARSSVRAVERVSKRLVDAAELRTDVRALRVCVHWIHELNPRTGSRVLAGVAGHVGGQNIEVELQHRFIDALSNRLNVVEFELVEQSDPKAMSSGVQALVDTYGVTHVVVGDFVRRGDELDVSVRLVDAQTLLIVASASGVVPIGALSDDVQAYDTTRGMGMWPFSRSRSHDPSETVADGGAAAAVPVEDDAAQAQPEAPGDGPAAQRTLALDPTLG